jgi:hypothetical protein
MTTIYGTDLQIGPLLSKFLSKNVGKMSVATYLLDGFVSETVATNATVNYLEVIDGGNIEYTPKGKVMEYPYDNFKVKGRTSATPGKALRKVLKPEAFGTQTFALKRKGTNGAVCEIPQISDAAIEQFTIALQSEFRPFECFIVTGEAVRYWYDESTYTTREKTTLHNSCMRRSDNWHQSRNYAQNPRTIGMLCVTDAEGKLTARAVVWNSPLGMLVDRIYGSDQNREAIRKFAAKRGWMTRDGDAAQNNGLTKPSGEHIDYYIVPIQHWVASNKPYMDTLAPHQLHASGHFYGESNDRYLSDSRRNPIQYSFCAYGTMPTRRTTSHPIWRPGLGSLSQEMLDERVAWLSNFDHIPAWPADLIRSDPTWKLGEKPEDDTSNWNRLPKRRTEGYQVPKPKPTPSTWKSGILGDITTGLTQDGINALDYNIQALAEAFANIEEAAVPRVMLEGVDPNADDFFAVEAQFGN